MLWGSMFSNISIENKILLNHIQWLFLMRAAWVPKVRPQAEQRSLIICERQGQSRRPQVSANETGKREKPCTWRLQASMRFYHQSSDCKAMPCSSASRDARVKGCIDKIPRLSLKIVTQTTPMQICSVHWLGWHGDAVGLVRDAPLLPELVNPLQFNLREEFRTGVENRFQRGGDWHRWGMGWLQINIIIFKVSPSWPFTM